MRLLPAAVLAALITPLVASHVGAAEIEVADPADVALIAAIDGAVSTATGSVGACREAGGDLAACLCANIGDIGRVGAALDAALDRHPEWEGKALFVRDIGGGHSLTIWLDTVAGMAAPPDCG